MSTSFSQSGRTALFHACWDGKTEVVRELLQRQADVNIPTNVSLSLGYPSPDTPHMSSLSNFNFVDIVIQIMNFHVVMKSNWLCDP